MTTKTPKRRIRPITGKPRNPKTGEQHRRIRPITGRPANPAPSKSAVGPVRLRYPRKEVMRKLGISMSTIIRREQAGKLRPIRDVPGGAVFYSHADVMRLANG